MNPREKRMLIALVLTVGVGSAGLGAYLWFVKPLQAYNKTIATLRDERDLESLKWDTFNEERKRLEWARLKSLPMKPEDASSEYQNYLERMIDQTGLKLVSINASAAVKVKPAGQIQGVKEVGHLTLSFTVAARGELADLIQFMELLRKTPYEHRIKSLNIDRADASYARSADKKLNINMTIETLLVAKNENKPGHPPGIDPRYLIYDNVAARSWLGPMGFGEAASLAALKLTFPTPIRNYADIAEKNIFVGYLPPPAGPALEKAAKIGNIPAYIRLVHTVPSHKEAYLLNLYYRNEELKLSADPATGYDVRRISDDEGKYIFFFMKVLRVDSGVVYYQVQKHVFAISLGQTLADSLQYPLSIERLDALDLDWDREWAKKMMDTEEKSQGGKTPTKKGYKKGG